MFTDKLWDMSSYACKYERGMPNQKGEKIVEGYVLRDLVGFQLIML